MWKHATCTSWEHVRLKRFIHTDFLIPLMAAADLGAPPCRSVPPRRPACRARRRRGIRPCPRRHQHRRQRLVSIIPSTVLDQLEQQAIELPSWAFGNSGTRFKVFAQPGVPRDPFEKIADAAQVHKYTGARADRRAAHPVGQGRRLPALRSMPKTTASRSARSTRTRSRTTTTSSAASRIATRASGRRRSTTTSRASTS